MGRFWQVVEKHEINLFYTAPTALRALMKEGDTWVEKYDRSTLRLLGTVGEPIKERNGCGIIMLLETSDVRLLIHGGRLKLVVFS